MALNLLVSLERLRDAFRGMRTYNAPCALPDGWVARAVREPVEPRFEVHVRDGLGNVLVAGNEIPVYQGDRVHRPSPGRQDCPICRELPVPAAPRVSLVETAERLGLLERRPNPVAVLEPEFQPGGIVQAPEPVHPCGGPLHCPVCADWAGRVRHPLSSCEPALFGSFWVDGRDRPAPSYTAEVAMEEIRRAGERPSAGLAARYIPVEGPTAACSSCPALVPPEELWVGKKSGIALCDTCMATWEKAGRARRTGEF